MHRRTQHWLLGIFLASVLALAGAAISMAQVSATPADFPFRVTAHYVKDVPTIDFHTANIGKVSGKLLVRHRETATVVLEDKLLPTDWRDVVITDTKRISGTLDFYIDGIPAGYLGYEQPNKDFRTQLELRYMYDDEDPTLRPFYIWQVKLAKNTNGWMRTMWVNDCDAPDNPEQESQLWGRYPFYSYMVGEGSDDSPVAGCIRFRFDNPIVYQFSYRLADVPWPPVTPVPTHAAYVPAVMNFRPEPTLVPPNGPAPTLVPASNASLSGVEAEKPYPAPATNP